MKKTTEINDPNKFFEDLKAKQLNMLDEQVIDGNQWFVSLHPNVIDPDIKVAFLKRSKIEGDVVERSYYIPFYYLDKYELVELQTIKQIYFEDWYMLEPSREDLDFDRYYIIFVKEKNLFRKLFKNLWKN